MSTKVDAQRQYNHYYVNAVARMNELSFMYAKTPWLWLKPIWWLTGYAKEYNENLRMVTDFTRKVSYLLY